MTNKMQTYNLKKFKNKHNGEWCLVCGMGPSLKKLVNYPFFDIDTFGVSEINDIFIPTYHVFSEPISMERKLIQGNPEWIRKERVMLDTESLHIFSGNDCEFKRPSIHLPLCGIANTHGNPDDNTPSKSIKSIFRENKIPCFRKTITASIGLSLYMGYGTIGIIGMDYIGERVMNRSSCNLVMPPVRMKQYDKQMKVYDDYARSEGIDILNLSEISLVTAFRKVAIEKFFEEWRKCTKAKRK